MSAAELSLWTRRRKTTRDEVKAALWKKRELVKTTSMRGTLHLLPARDFPMYIARKDLGELATSTLDRSPTLLPAFDTFLLAHSTKDHLVEKRFYKRVYRNQGWLSPVVVASGRIVAVWFLEERAKAFTVDVQPFGALDAKVRRGIADEAEALGEFLGARCDVQYKAI